MRSEINLNYYYNASNKYKSNYILGINKNSGRLQLFPKIRCFSTIYLLLMIMIITIIIILLSSMEVINTSTIDLSNNYEKNNYKTNTNNITSLIMHPRCIPIEYGNMENLDIEQKELLKDVRTSFIPSDQIIIPPECVKSDNDASYNYFGSYNYIGDAYNRLRRYLKEKFNDNNHNYGQDDFSEKSDKILSLKNQNEPISDNGNLNQNNENCCNNNEFIKYSDKEKKDSKFDNSKDTQFDSDSKELKRTEKNIIRSNSERYKKEEEPLLPKKIDILTKTEFKLEHDQYYNNLRENNISHNQLNHEHDKKILKKLNANTFFSTGTKDYIRNLQAETMKKYMDLTVDPCVDFYAFACGNWGKINPIPQDKAGYDTFEILRENLDSVLQSLLTEKDDAEVTLIQIPEKFSPLTELHFENFKNIYEPNSKLQLFKRHKRQINIYRKRRYLAGNFIRTKRQFQQYSFVNVIQRPQNAETKAKNLYYSCMNYDVLNEKGAQPLFDLLVDLGGWPVLDPNWSDDNFNWLNLTAQLRLYNNDILIVQWVGPDIKNSDENIMQLDQTNLGLPTRDYYLHESNRKYLKAYQDFMIEIIEILGAQKCDAEAVSEQIIEFETRLANITEPAELRVNISNLYNRMKIKNLCVEIPEIDWTFYLSVIQNRNVDPNEEIVVYSMNYMRNLVRLLQNTESRTVANYLMWRFARHRINNLDNRFQNAKQKFFYSLFGREKNPPRWKNCVGQVNSNMGMALGAMFVRKYFDENSKKDTLKMTHDIQESFHKIIKNTDWLDPITKALAEEKVSKMSLKIGYPDLILNNEELDKKYAGLEIIPEEYFENTLRVLRFVSEVEQKKIGEAVNKTIWQTAPAIVNAYYSRNKNQIMFPAGILQPPFYHHYFPRSLNYGGIGVVIGHELTHGFDDKGRLFDSNGNICKWWSDFSINAFHERARCLVTQYGNYTIDEIGMAIDGESTQGENIADNGGINQAFRAYTNWLNENDYDENLEENETLPDLNITNKQLFFLNFAQVWCGSFRPEASKNKIKTAVHAPGKFRVIGTVSNSVDFAREFKCKLGAPMNPAKKCKVW